MNEVPDAPNPTGGRVVAHVLVTLAVFDLGLALLLVFFWTTVASVADVRVTAALVTIRALASAALLYSMLEPVRRWLAQPKPSDAELVGADAALQAIETRYVLRYILGWQLSLLASLALGQLGLPQAIELGRTELATALVMLGTLASASLLTRELIRSLSLPALRILSEDMRARGLAGARPPRSFGASMRVAMVAIVVGSLPGLTMLGGFMRVQGIRAEASMDQLRRAEIGALTFAEADALEPGLTVLAPEDLPEHVASPLASPLAPTVSGIDTTTHRRGFDREAREALGAVALPDGRWLLARAPVDEQLGPILVVVLMTTVMTGLLALLVSNALWSAQREGLDALDRATRGVAERGDLHALGRLTPLRNDEFGRLALNFNAMLDMLDELTRAATAVARGDLRVELTHPGDLHDAFRGMLAQLSEVVGQLRGTAVELATTAREIHASTRTQAELGERQTHAVNQVVTTLGSLAAAAHDIAAEASEVLNNAELGRGATDTVIEKMAELGHHVAGIAALLRQVQEVADRSDLLALNGALEATRAGDAGRGFALVAAEMRRLAERVSAVVSDVQLRIADIERSTAGTTEASGNSRALADRTSTAAGQISTVIQRQSRETEDVSRAVDAVASAAQATAAATVQTEAAAEGLRIQAEELELLLGRFELPS